MRRQRQLLASGLVLLALIVGLVGVAHAEGAEPPREQRVKFEGVVAAMVDGDPDVWTIETRRGSVDVQVTGETRIVNGPAEVGDRVRVVARVQGSTMEAEVIEVRQHGRPPREVEFRGVIRAMEPISDTPDAELWTVGHVQVVVTTTTTIEGTPDVGDMAEVHAVYQEERLVATKIKVEDETHPPRPVEFRGVIAAIEPTDTWPQLWTVGTYTVTVTQDTRIIGQPAVGATAEVHALVQDDGSLLATRIVVLPPEPTPEGGRVKLTGVIQEKDDTVWIISSVPVSVDASTRIDTQHGDPIENAPVAVDAVVAAVDSGWQLTARHIKVLQHEPDEGVVKIEGELLSMGGEAAALDGANQTWVVGGISVEVTSDTEIEGTPAVGVRVKVRAVLSEGHLVAVKVEVDGHGPGETPEPSRTPRPTRTPEPTGTPEPTATSEPTETPEPMETPEPQEVEFTGEIKELPASGLIGNWVIGNYTVQVTAETEVRGRPEVGRRAEVKGWLLGDSLVQARRIKVKGR